MKSRIKIILPRKISLPKTIFYTNKNNLVKYNEKVIEELKTNKYINVITAHNRIIIDVIKYNGFYSINKDSQTIVLVFDDKHFNLISFKPHDIKNPALTKFYTSKVFREYFIDGIKIKEENFKKAVKEYKIKKVLKHS